MAFELPVVSSNLLSTPYYVRDQLEGLLTSPGDVPAIAHAMAQLCADVTLRTTLGRAGRARVSELCDLQRNSARLQSIIINGRWRHWRAKLAALLERRTTYTTAIEDYYTTCRARAVEYFQPHGRLLDIGCGHGKLRDHLGPDVTYVGCDPIPLQQGNEEFPFVVAGGEALPFHQAVFDAVLLYSVLPSVFDVDAVLGEAMRVLKPGGLLYLRECVNDPNPLHLNHLTDVDLKHRISEYCHILDTRWDGERMLLIKAQKPAPPRIEITATPPLVSIAITTYNSQAFIGICIESALKQSYQPVEVVVVDDGSTDGTRRILEAYGSQIRVAYNDHNHGIAYARNRALRMTSPAATYVANLDSDDYFHPRFAERCVAFLEQHPEIGLVYTDDIVIDVHGRELRRRQAVEPWSVEAWLRTCNLRGDTWVARRDMVMKTSLHDEALSCDVDYDLFYQLLESTTFAHVGEFLVYYRQHDGQSGRMQLRIS